VLAAAPFALRLPSVAQGCSEAIRGSEAEYVSKALQRELGEGAANTAIVVVSSSQIPVADPRFAATVRTLETAIKTEGAVRAVVHAWNSPNDALLGQDGKSALFLVRPGVSSLAEAEAFTAILRNLIRDARLPADFAVSVTGQAATLHDINRNSSADLLNAERVGIPLTVVVLLAVFGSPLIAGLAVALAFAAVVLAAAALYAMSAWLPVTVFAQNVITIIGLGAGVDYCLFFLYRYRTALRRGLPPAAAVMSAAQGAGTAIGVAGVTVAAGFLALLLVNARIFQSLAIGGFLVALFAVAAALTLLPPLLLSIGDGSRWYADGAHESALNRMLQSWCGRFSIHVMRYPLLTLGLALALVAIIAAPVMHMQARSVGVGDLPAQIESRRGFERLARDFEQGWMGPAVVLLEPGPTADAHGELARQAVFATAAWLEHDSRVARVYVREGAVAIITVITRYPPESPEMIRYVRELRAREWSDAAAAGLNVKIGGTSALLLDFDAEMFGSLWKVIPAVLGMSFFAVLFFFRSILIPLKAIAVNLLCVLATYGLLVSAFQDSAGVYGGLNSFVVVMLFTILFGLSMDYEVILMRQIQDQYFITGDNGKAVVSGLEQCAGVITSAAAIMVCLFASLACAQLAATRQFGIGMAFAIALDATLMRLLLIPAAMTLLGRANWWCPGLSSRPGVMAVSRAVESGSPQRWRARSGEPRH
jgi:RND superfamily putative drug exporter